MSLAGTGAVAIWNDVRAGERDMMTEWHDREHIPERVGIPGFLRGRRFVALQGSPEYFILYETADVAAAQSPAYFARLNNPSAWTVRANKSFLNTVRGICEVPVSLGHAEGGCVLTLRLDPGPAAAAALRIFMAEQALPAALREVGIVAAHLLVAQRQVSLVETTERIGRAPLKAPNHVIVLEGHSPAALQAAAEKHLRDDLLAALGGPGERGLYQLQVARSAGHRG
jgi:hypothetical protein